MPPPKTLKSGSRRSFWEGVARPSPRLAKEDLGLGVQRLGHRLQLRRRLAERRPARCRCPRSAVILPQSPASAASIACSPKRVASTRSKAVGVPPRWTWPSTVARASLPVRRSISPSSQWAMPPRRTWPKASSSLVVGARHRRPSAGRPRRRRRSARTGCSKRRPTQLADPLEVEGPLGDQDHVGAAGEAGVEGDPAGVAAHHLDDQHPVVAVGGGVQAVDRLHRDVDRGVEAEGVVGGAEVVVDRLRHADDVHAVLVVQARRRRRACPRRRSRSARRRRPPSRFSAIRSAPPSSVNGLVREEPRIVPPRGRMPRTSGTPSGRLSPSSGPRQPSR